MLPQKKTAAKTCPEFLRRRDDMDVGERNSRRPPEHHNR